MKILFITNGYPPERRAGTEIYTAGLAGELLKRGYGVQVLAGGRADGPTYWNGVRDEIHDGVPVRRIDLNWEKAPDPSLYLYNNPVVAEYLQRYLSNVQPDVVHLLSGERLSASVMETVKNVGIPLVLSLTDFWFLCPRIQLLRSDHQNCTGQTTPWECLKCQLYEAKAYTIPAKLMSEQMIAPFLTLISKQPLMTRQAGLRGLAGDMTDRKAFLQHALTLADYRVTASHFVHDIFVQNGVTVPINVSPYGHNLTWMENYHGKPASDKVRFGFIGNIIEAKGVHLLLEASQRLQAQFGDQFSVAIYGNVDKDPNYGPRIRQLAERQPNVELRGLYARPESAEVYAGFDVLVVPSLWYDFPLVIQEAFVTKTAVITSNLGGMAEAVDHAVNGLLFERANATDLARQMQTVIEDRALLAELQANTPPVKTMEAEIDGFEEVYRSLVRSA